MVEPPELEVQRAARVAPVQAQEFSRPKPMCWAEDVATGKAVHVATLPREKTGSACGCVCPACKEALQAVNAGRDADYFRRKGARGRFFRHTSGHTRDACLKLAGQVAVLQTLAQGDQLHVPGPRRTVQLQGLSGDFYLGAAQGGAHTLRVTRRSWMDIQSASLTLEDGRTVWLVLESRFSVSEASKFDGVISIQVDDPDVAGMSAEEILARIDLQPQSLCWRKHWDDAQLDMQAHLQAEQAAKDAIDWLDDEERALLGGVSISRESALHLAIKNIIAQAGHILAPCLYLADSIQLSNGKVLTTQKTFDLGLMQLRHVRLEHWMPGIVADIFCQSQEPSGLHDLLIEVVVTSPVSEAKSARIRERGLRCMVVDVALFAQPGPISMAALKDHVLYSTTTKYWLHHPEMEAQWGAALLELQRNAAAVEQELQMQQERLEHEALQAQREREHQNAQAQAHRGAWRQELMRVAPSELPELFRWAVTTHARHERERSMPDCPVDIPSTAEAMERAQFHDTHNSELWHNQGLIVNLEMIKRGSPTGEILMRLREAVAGRGLRSYVTILLIAIRVYEPPFTPAERAALAQMRSQVRESIERGKKEFVRLVKHDRIIGRLYPEMAGGLQHEFGTLAYAIKQTGAMADALFKLEAASKPQKADPDPTGGLHWEFEKLRRVSWMKGDVPFCADAEQALALQQVKKLAGQASRLQMDPLDVLTRAFRAKADGIHVYDWAKSLHLGTKVELQLVLDLARAAWLI